MFNIGIVGLGQNGMMHLRGFQRLENSRVAAVCDIDEGNISKALKILDDDSVFTTTKFNELCKLKELDAVCICTPTWKHVPVALAALDNGKDVFMEKPIAPTMEETDKLITRAFATDRIVQIGLVYRYCNLYRTMAEMVERGDFGNVMMAYCKEYRDNFPTQWFFETKKSGGALLDKDCHHFDVFSWLIRSKPVKVYAVGGQHVVKGNKVKINCSYAADKNLMIKKPDILDHAYVLVQYENSAVANLGLCMYEVEPLEGLEIGIMGDNGTHALAKKDIVLTAGGGPLGELREIPVDYQSDNHGIGHIGADAQHVEFLQCMESRELPFANLLLARESMVVCLAAEKSITEKREILISEFDNPAITKLIKKHNKDLSRLSPAPLPPPPPKSAKKSSREKELADAFIDFVRLLIGKRPRGEAKPFEPSVFIRVAEKLNADQKYLKLAKGLTSVIAFEFPGKTPVYIKITDGKIEIFNEGGGLESVKVIFSEDGWKDLQTGDSVHKLVLTRQIKVEGNIDKLAPYMEAFVLIGSKIGEME